MLKGEGKINDELIEKLMNWRPGFDNPKLTRKRG